MKGTRVGLIDGGDGGDDLAEFELVEDGGFTGGVEADHEDPHLLLGEEPAEELPEREPHLSLRGGPPSFTTCTIITPFIHSPLRSLPTNPSHTTDREPPRRVQADGAADLNRPDPAPTARVGRADHALAGTPGEEEIRGREL